MQKYTKYIVFEVCRYYFFFYFSSFIFKVPVEKVVGEEELQIDGILNFENLSRTVFIDEEYSNLKIVTDVGELTRNITI